MLSSKTFYTYLWLREDGTPYYVGKGSGKRAIRKGSPKDLNCILIQEFPSEADAFAAERFLIAYYGRKDLGTGILRNLSDGGDGNSGHKHSEAHKLMMRQIMLGRISPMKGRCHSPKTRSKIAESHKGKIVSAETRRKMSDSFQGKGLGRIPWNKGKTMSADLKDKLSAAQKKIGSRPPSREGCIPWNKGKSGYSKLLRDSVSGRSLNPLHGRGTHQLTPISRYPPSLCLSDQDAPLQNLQRVP